MLTDDEILQSRAYTLELHPEAFDPYQDRKGRQLSFTAWYDSDFPMEGEYLGQNVMREHCPPLTKRVLEEIEALSCNIRSKGLLNPVIVTQKAGMWHLHPGKCRVAALKMLGIDKIPAICVSYDQKKVPDRANYEIDRPDQYYAHFTGDIVPEFTYRALRSPKVRVR